MHCYWCSIANGNLTLTEHEAARWLTKEQFDSVNWLPADKIVVNELMQAISERSKNMAAIHSKGTKPEMVVRKWLWKRGFRYRLNSARLPGHPDLVLKRYRTCIFVNGCFWHGHHVNLRFDDLPFTIENSECCKIPHTNREFWVAKIQRNQERDAEERRLLKKMGWHCITIWECDLKPAKREQTLESLAFTLNEIYLQDHRAKQYNIEEEVLPRAAEE